MRRRTERMNRTRRRRLLRTPRIAPEKERRALRAATRVTFTRDERGV
jgi:hypothetical protein